MFAPPVFGGAMPSLMIASILGTLYLLMKKSLMKVVSCYKNEFLFLILFFVFLVIRSITGNSYKHLLSIIAFPFYFIIVPNSIKMFFDKKQINFYHVILIFILVNAIFSVIQYILPSLDSLVRSILPQVDKNNPLIFYYMGIRGFGFASGLFFSYPIVIGFFTVLFINESISQKKYTRLILVLFPLFAIMINARTGLVPIIFYFAYLLIANIGVKKIAQLILLCFLIYLSFFILQTSKLLETSKFATMINWTFEIFEEIYNYFVYGETSGYMYLLFDKFIVFPESTLEWIFGSGNYIFTNAPRTSDIGFILQLNFGGLVYLALMFSFILYIYNRMKNQIIYNKLHNLSVLPILYLITFVIANYKGDAFGDNVIFAAFGLVYSYVINPKTFLPLSENPNETVKIYKTE